MDELVAFAQSEHARLTKHFANTGNTRNKYTGLAKLMEELGELSEAILKSDSLQRTAKLEETKQAIEEELADVILCAFVLSCECNIDIKAALQDKMKKIQAREY